MLTHKLEKEIVLYKEQFENPWDTFIKKFEVVK